MTAPHFFAGDVSGDLVSLDERDSRHALRVLRLRPGEPITISDGAGSVVDAVVEPDGDRLVAEVTARRTVEAPRPALHVYQAIPKKGKLDLVVQKLTEIGVAAIHPFAGERSVPRWDAPKAGSRSDRLAEVARQAAMQSRRAWLPVVHPPVPLPSLGLVEPAVVLHESASERLTRAIPEEAPPAFGLAVGPEGGFTDQEVTAFRERGAVPVSLGPTILRTETAALVASVILLTRYGVLG